MIYINKSKYLQTFLLFYCHIKNNNLHIKFLLRNFVSYNLKNGTC